ncbi:hypothetical protein HTG_14985 [Natrinema mahii]|nr:hypothetical protein HTG_14985 [Natrinema mahii]
MTRPTAAAVEAASATDEIAVRYVDPEPTATVVPTALERLQQLLENRFRNALDHGVPDRGYQRRPDRDRRRLCGRLLRRRHRVWHPRRGPGLGLRHRLSHRRGGNRVRARNRQTGRRRSWRPTASRSARASRSPASMRRATATRVETAGRAGGRFSTPLVVARGRVADSGQAPPSAPARRSGGRSSRPAPSAGSQSDSGRPAAG